MIDGSIYREMETNGSEFRKMVKTLGREAFVTGARVYAVIGATG